MTKSYSVLLFTLLCALVSGQAPVWGQVHITEFMASNSGTLQDEDGSYEDWIEVQNVSSANVSLLDWSLTDSSGNLTKWRFPATNLPPDGYLIVFASNKDRHSAGAPLHTNFKLDADGEYLALVDPTGTNIVTQFSPKYPPQVPNVSFGFALTATNLTLVATGATARVLVPSPNNGGSGLNYAWTGSSTNEPFNTAPWMNGATGVGFGTGAPGEIGLNLQSAMLNSNASAFVRLPFVVDNPTNFSLLTLRLKYDDGFVAWINGNELARAYAPDENLNWDSAATSVHAASAFESMTFGVAPGWLRSGTNILAIQGLNIAASNGSFLILPELIGTSVAGESTSGLYFTQPTPGGENTGGATVPGPGIANVLHTPNVPLDDDNLLVTAKVFPTVRPVTGVVLHYRVMFGSEVALTMFDDGAHGDGAPGDGIYGNSIPAGASTDGEMVRYYITAQDTSNTVSRLPVFTDPAATAEYFGTVVNPDYVTSALPVVHLFAHDSVLDPGPTAPVNGVGADSNTGGRVSLFFDGEFYDNVFMFLRGNTTAVYPKKSHRIRFNTEHKFRSREPGDRLKNTSFVADYSDPTYMRQGLSFWLSDEIGASGPFYAPYRLQLNGAFYQLANHNDVHGEELLERLGYDPNGALYNAMGTIEPPTINSNGTWSIFSNGGWEKKTRKWDTNGLDYLDLSATISSSLPKGEVMTNIFDRLDLPEVISYMVAARIVNESDDVRANMSIYFDNDGDQLWRIIPFDMNLSWGASYYLGPTYNGIQATNDILKSHPFYGAAQAIPPDYIAPSNWNRLYDAIIAVPATRQMFQRRMRTVLDEYVKPPGLAPEQSPIYQKAIAWRDRIATEAANDRAWWGWPAKNGQSNFDPGIDLTNGVNILLNEYLDVRRGHLYGKHSVTNTALSVGITRTNSAGFPLPQPPSAAISIIAWDYNPVSGNQNEEYVQLTNGNWYAVDVSGWELDGGIQFKFKPGTVVPAYSSIYVSPNTRAFRARVTSPRGGQGLFVVGPCEGHLNAWGETLLLKNEKNSIVASNGFAGSPSLAQRYLRVTEIMYNPSPAAAITNDAQLFEYVELRNISTNETLNLNGVRFTNGIYFNFTGSAMTSLGPQQTVLLVRSQPAFTARHGGGLNIAGTFGGALDNGGEALRLEDASGEKILEFAYNDSWYPITDGLGFSLVIVNENAPWDSWDKKSSWRASGSLNGSPGVPDPAAPAFSPILVNEVLTHTDLPTLDSVELSNPTTNTVDLGGWFLTDDFYTPKKYRIPNGTLILPNAYRVYDESAFNTGPNAFRFSELGEFVYLFSGDANTNLTGYHHGYEFGEAPNGVPFGRYINSQGDGFFPLQSTATPGASNAYPRVGPLVISEIMYRPPDTNGADDDMDEFIELQNISLSNVALYDPSAPTNTWRLRNAVDFDFPTNQSLASGARLLVVGFDPTNAIQLAAFKARYAVPANVAVYGPWSGKLDNSEETIELKQPDAPDVTPTVTTIPFIMIDKVSYEDDAPWPAGADGLGNSLQRVSNTGFGNDPTNWFAAGVTAGRATVPDQSPTVSINSPANGVTIMASNGVTVSVVAGDNDGSVALVQLFANDTELAQWTVASSNYFWSAPPAGTYELRARAADNLGAVAESQPVTVHVVTQLPELTLLSPTNGAIIAEGSSVNLAVSASGGGQATSADFLLDGAWIGTVGLPLSMTWTATSAGTRVVSAVGRDAAGELGPAATAIVSVQRITNYSFVLVPSNATGWKYLDNGSNQGTNWTGLNFDDTSWSTGTAQFGYGEGDENTVISYGPSSGNKYPTTYFRYTFVVSSLAGIDNVSLGVLRDDGAIAYVNGVEVFRSNLTNGPVNYQTYALTTIGGVDEDTYYPTNFSPALLVAGTNVLTVEVHQVTTNSTDLSFDAQLTLQGALLGPAFLVQPTNQSVPAGSSATFAVSTTGTEPISLRWYSNNVPLAAVTNTLTLTNVQAADAGPYHVVASNVVGVATSSVVSLTVTSGDTDGDGMPDSWELANGTNPTTNDAGVDLDLDGFNNLQEFIAGTSPTNQLSALKFDSVRQNGTNVEFSFAAMSNRTYTIQFRPSALDGTWQGWTDVLAAPSNRAIWLTNPATASTNRFFRLVTPLLP